jgi:hypothetical protein
MVKRKSLPQRGIEPKSSIPIVGTILTELLTPTFLAAMIHLVLDTKWKIT